MDRGGRQDGSGTGGYRIGMGGNGRDTKGWGGMMGDGMDGEWMGGGWNGMDGGGIRPSGGGDYLRYGGGWDKG